MIIAQLGVPVEIVKPAELAQRVRDTGGVMARCGHGFPALR